MRILYLVTLVLAVIGAINWGLLGLLQLDLVAAIFANTLILRFIYIVIGISGIILLVTSIRWLVRCKKDADIDHNVEVKQKIHPDSPAQDEQHKFIEEGGDSQSLNK